MFYCLKEIPRRPDVYIDKFVFKESGGYQSGATDLLDELEELKVCTNQLAFADVFSLNPDKNALFVMFYSSEIEPNGEVVSRDENTFFFHHNGI